MFNKIIGIFTALVMFAGLGPIAADSAIPLNSMYHQNEIKNIFQSSNKSLLNRVGETSFHPVDKNPSTMGILEPVLRLRTDVWIKDQKLEIL
jgi:hypothetical protein